MNERVRFFETHASNHVYRKEGAPSLVAKFSGRIATTHFKSMQAALREL
jgi:hypothetical protein